jgi:hypothetical protein
MQKIYGILVNDTMVNRNDRMISEKLFERIKRGNFKNKSIKSFSEDVEITETTL